MHASDGAVSGTVDIGGSSNCYVHSKCISTGTPGRHCKLQTDLSRRTIQPIVLGRNEKFASPWIEPEDTINESQEKQAEICEA